MRQPPPYAPEDSALEEGADLWTEPIAGRDQTYRKLVYRSPKGVKTERTIRVSAMPVRQVLHEIERKDRTAG